MCMFCQRLIVVILEYHAHFVYDQCFLLQRRSGVDGVCNHFHDFRYTVNRGQCAHQSLHCNFSCLYRQCFQRAACFLDKISKECFLFFFCSHRKIFWQMELEQFVIEIAEEAFPNEIFCHKDFLGVFCEVGKCIHLLQQFIFFFADGVCFVDNRFYSLFQLFVQCIQISFPFGFVQFACQKFADGMIQVAVCRIAFCQVCKAVCQVEQQNQRV